MQFTNRRVPRRRRLAALAAAFVTATGALSACGDGAGDGEDEPIRLAALYPTSGSLALLGEESWRGAQIAAKLRNADGGIAGRKIELVKADVPDVNATTSEARRLLTDERLDLAIGTYSSSLALAASEVYARGRGTYVELGAISTEFNSRDYDSVWRTSPSAASFAQVQLDFITEWAAGALKKSLSELKIVLVHEDSSYGSSVARSAEELAKDAGIADITYAPYNAEATDLSSVVLRLKSAKPDIVIAVSYASDAILLARQMSQNGVVVPAFIGTGGGHTLKSFGETVGEAAEGVFNVDFTQFAVKQGAAPGLTEFVEAYTEEFGTEPASGHSLANFMGANAVFDILEETGGDTSVSAFGAGAKDYTADEGTTATGWGIEFDETGQNTLAAPYVMQWRDGKLETVWPQRVATMEPVLAQ